MEAEHRRPDLQESRLYFTAAMMTAVRLTNAVTRPTRATRAFKCSYSLPRPGSSGFEALKAAGGVSTNTRWGGVSETDTSQTVAAPLPSCWPGLGVSAWRSDRPPRRHPP